jgi:dethiobiotin synthetase
MMEARNNVLMISGASPNAGKTFVSSNLAAVISQTGKKYCLLIQICVKATRINCSMKVIPMVSLIFCQEKLRLIKG